MSESAEGKGLSSEQQKVIQLALDDINIFFTGAAGTGKTRVLFSLVKSLKEKFGWNSVGVTATIGIAATQIDGQTLHSWAGIGLRKGSRYILLDQIISNEEARCRWINTKVLIIDEISMLDRELFETLEFLARRVRCSEDRFGGLQLVVCGDFQQLPPVISINKEGRTNDDLPYCFKSSKWDECIDASVKLTTVFRQNDEVLLTLLSEIRRGGHISPNAQEIIKDIEKVEDAIVDPSTVFLFGRRIEVEMKNNSILEQVDGEKVVSQAKDTGNKEQLKDCPFPRNLAYKICARVMLLINIHKLGLANGSIGTIINVAGDRPIVKFDNGLVTTIRPYIWSARNEEEVVTATRRQLPLQLSWAMTIHKSQGQTLPNIAVSLRNMFAYGQAYVALSRATCLEGLSILPGWDQHIPQTPPVLNDFNRKVVPVNDFEPVLKSAMLAIHDDCETPEDDTSNQTARTSANLQWPTNLSLPSAVNLSEVLADVESRQGRSSVYREYVQSLRQLLVASNEFPKFAAYCWDRLENIYIPTGAYALLDIQEAMSRKSINVKTRKFCTLQRSDDLKEMLLDVLKKSEVVTTDKEKLSFEQLTFLFDLILVLRKHMTGMMVNKVLGEEEENTVLAEVEIGKAEQAKVRYVAGWVMFKIRSAAHDYVEKNKCTSNSAVKSTIAKEQKVLHLMEKLTTSRDDALRNTVYPDSLSHIEYHNRGALQHVPDSVFLFFIELEKSCQKKYNADVIIEHQRDGLKVARNLVKSCPIVKLAWKNLMVSADIPTVEDGETTSLVETLFQRVLKRYLNMRSKELIKKVRKDAKVSKEQALRQALHKRKATSKTANELKEVLNTLVAETSTDKVASHLKLKALALTNKETFAGYTKGHLRYLYLVYGIPFSKSKSKKALSIHLSDKIISCERIPAQKMVSQSLMERVLQLHGEGKKVDAASLGIEAATVVQTPQSANDVTQEGTSRQVERSNVNGEEVRPRRQRFKATENQDQILQEDNRAHDGKVPRELRSRRAMEFNVDETQIQRWHLTYNKNK